MPKIIARKNENKNHPTVKIGPFVAPHDHLLLVSFGISCPDENVLEATISVDVDLRQIDKRFASHAQSSWKTQPKIV
jgi:hypothetical protein